MIFTAQTSIPEHEKCKIVKEMFLQKNGDFESEMQNLKESCPV
jgi:hypothetical protein